MLARRNYWPVVEAEAERRIAHGEEPENARELARRCSVYRNSSAHKWAVTEAVIRDIQFDSGAFRKAVIANAAALAKKAEELERAGRERFDRTDYRAALTHVLQALALHHTESRERFALTLGGLVRMDDARMMSPVPSMDDVVPCRIDVEHAEEAPRRDEPVPEPTQSSVLSSGGATPPKTIRRRIFEFIDAHQGCLTRDITKHMRRSVRKFLDEMDRGGVIVRVTKRDKYACSDARQKLHFTADQHVGHIGRYGIGG